MNAELTRALAFQRYRNLATLERARGRQMTHTPGPWRVGKRGAIQNAVLDGRAVPYPVIPIEGAEAAVYAPSTSPNAEANARLIAAAPDMLAALKAWHAFMSEGWITNNNEDPEALALLQQSKAAIAKAEGRG